jgi:hypothetical protein
MQLIITVFLVLDSMPEGLRGEVRQNLIAGD